MAQLRGHMAPDMGWEVDIKPEGEFYRLQFSRTPERQADPGEDHSNEAAP